MPELPEIAHLGRTLAPGVTGAVVGRVELLRRDVVRRRRGRTRHQRRRVSAADLLAGGRLAQILRHGKELALVADDGRVMVVHLGMSGQLWLCGPGRPLARRDHVHCIWQLKHQGRAAGRLVFRDPRRFGGLWTYASVAELRSGRWSRLGPDALTLTACQLRDAVAGSRRAIKAALLDQSVTAGVGNIYADESLFDARVHPRAAAGALGPDSTRRLAASIRRILRRAIDRGGSTIRDYVDACGDAGGYAASHKVYGRAGAGCPRCGQALVRLVLAQRTTVCCERCQRCDD